MKKLIEIEKIIQSRYDSVDIILDDENFDFNGYEQIYEYYVGRQDAYEDILKVLIDL